MSIDIINTSWHTFQTDDLHLNPLSQNVNSDKCYIIYMQLTY